MLQKISKKIDLVENADGILDKMFSGIGPGDEIGLQNYRLEMQTEMGWLFSPYQPDGGAYPFGTGPEYSQGIIAPVPMILAGAVTELLQRISKAGSDVIVTDVIARMMGDVKKKAGHKRNQNLQGYNQGKLATVDATYSSGTTVQLKSTPFGARLIDKGDQVNFTDSSYNILGNVANVLDVSKNGVGTVDTITVDAVPVGLASGDFVILPNQASGSPLFLQGLEYIVTPQNTGDYLGIQRSNSFVQAPAFNANSAQITLGAVFALLTRGVQALGEERFQMERQKNRWYGHGAQWAGAQSLGFAKQVVMLSDGKAPVYDGVPSLFSAKELAGVGFDSDSTAATDKLYFLDKSCLVKIRYPGSEKFIPGPIDGMFFPGIQQSTGAYTSERFMYYQDSVQYATRNCWANAVLYGLGVPQVFSN